MDKKSGTSWHLPIKNKETQPTVCFQEVVSQFDISLLAKLLSAGSGYAYPASSTI